MASKSITLVIRPRGKPIKGLPEDIGLIASDSTSELYKKVASTTQYSVHRIRITKSSDGSLIPDSIDVTINQTGLRDKSVIHVKDLGPQLSWRAVYVVEYLGALILHPLVFYLRPYIYGTSTEPSDLQKISFALICIHFLKREMESIFVHRFSLATMPAFNIFKNSAHYWLLSGLNIAYWTYSPTAPNSQHSNNIISYIGIVLFIIGELGNLNAHLVLRNLRKPGTKERGIPNGIGFGLVTCPNYMFELLAWVGILLVNWSLSTLIFIIVGFAQMAVWAKKREIRYRKEFGDKYKRKRYTVLPGIH